MYQAVLVRQFVKTYLTAYFDINVARQGGHLIFSNKSMYTMQIYLQEVGGGAGADPSVVSSTCCFCRVSKQADSGHSCPIGVIIRSELLTRVIKTSVLIDWLLCDS